MFNTKFIWEIIEGKNEKMITWVFLHQLFKYYMYKEIKEEILKEIIRNPKINSWSFSSSFSAKETSKKKKSFFYAIIIDESFFCILELK